MHIQDVIIELLLKQPFYGYIASYVVPVQCDDVPMINMVTIPSMKLFYNKKWFEGLTEAQAVGVVIHELLHLILLHPYRKESREHNLWIIACDMAVNECIDKKLLLDSSITVEKVSKEIKEELPPLKSAEFYYDVIAKDEDKISFIEKDNIVSVTLNSGAELTAVKSMEGDSSEVNKSAFKSMFFELMDQAGMEGEVPDNISGFIDEIYKANDVNWRNVLKRFLSGKGKIILKKTYKRISKRYENVPGNKRMLGVNALLAIDESGSISMPQAVKFYNEILSINRITGTSLLVTEFDTTCTGPVPIERYSRDKRRVRNGGTDFRPVFTLADKMKIPVVIIFTDGDGAAPESVNQKVLWVLTKGGKKPVQYGECVVFGE